jgi:hypothetical protein
VPACAETTTQAILLLVPGGYRDGQMQLVFAVLVGLVWTG